MSSIIQAQPGLISGRKLEAPITIRFAEYNTRPKAIEDFQQAMFSARRFFVEASKNNTEAKAAQEAATPENPVAPPKYTDAELKDVEDQLKDNEKWMDELMKVQVTLKEFWRDPVIWVSDLEERGKRLQMTVRSSASGPGFALIEQCLRLSNRKAPKAPRPVKPSISSSTPVAEETAEAESEPATAEDVPEPQSTGVPTEEGPPIHGEL